MFLRYCLLLESSHTKSRIGSLPAQGYNPRLSHEFYRLRTFSIKKGRVVKLGDSMESRRSRSRSRSASRNASLNTSTCVSPMLGYSNSTSTRMSPILMDMEDNHHKMRVCMMGDTQVGKSSLVSQFLTSEHMNTYDSSLGELYQSMSLKTLI